MDVVIDGLGDADDRDLQIPFANGLVDQLGSQHGSVTADHEQDVDVHTFEGVDDFLGRLGASGGCQDGASEFMNGGHLFRGQFHDVMAVFGDESLQPVADTDGCGHVVMMVGFHDNGSDDIVEARAETTAGHQGAFGLGRIEIDLFPGTGFFKGNEQLFGSGFLDHVRADMDDGCFLGRDKGPERKRAVNFGNTKGID